MISVCIATHNGEKYIRQQLDSILCQLRSYDEVIVSDDGSTDCTINIIKSFNDDRIKIYHYKQAIKSRHAHRYVCNNFENALIHAKGDYIFLSDQDDYWMAGKVKRCIELLNTNLLVVHNAELVDQNLKSIGRMMYKNNFVFKNYLALKKGKYYGCTLAFRKELLNVILPFPNGLVLHDHWIGCIAELTGCVYYENSPLMKYRIHNSNTSVGPSKNGLFFRLQYRLYMFIQLIIRKYKLGIVPFPDAKNNKK